MSLITCCPACGTMFRVVPDQLKISEGWVRCGHCSEVFDASATLVEQADAVTAPAPAPPVPQPQVLHPQVLHPPALQPQIPALLQPPVEPHAAVAPADAEPPITEPPAELVAQVLAGEANTQPAALAREDGPQDARDAPPDSELEESPLDQPFVFRRSDLAESEGAPSVSPPIAESGFGLSRPGESESGWEAEQPQGVSFLRAARSRALWHTPRMRGLLVVLGLLLGALLAAQFAVHDRDRIAAAQPGLKPLLEALCAPLACRVGPPRQIDAVAIDSSAFNKLRGDTYRLAFTLKNGAVFPIAVPAMELTLTDTQDQPVLRRVLTPAEMGAPVATLGAGAEWSGAVTLAIAADGQAGRIAGYRLLAFYP
ncbi:DUF3426 domain-containing protein [Ramlibacter sp.]|uniref:DUF3426 domain-containing protein n=1 Tax=Ramlibacter sp. TaxID=1917967 RepID=UPI0017E2CFE1|nr:DUF3426 domain-containing protein [Ramlibacter sp.]MBA2672479.1 DUF3426 domain-containing protein [Ramlibacter sp.]